MTNNIRLNITHSQKTRVEHFLNNVSKDLEQVAFAPQELRGVDDSTVGFKFKVKGQSTFVIVIFTESYSHATAIESANLPARPDIKWTINGAILFGVESADEHTSRQMLSLFAGEE